MEDAEALPEGRGQHAGPRGRRHQGEGPEGNAHGPRVQALVHDEVDGEVLHGRIQELLDDAGQTMDLVHEEDVPLVQVGEDAHEIPAALERWPPPSRWPGWWPAWSCPGREARRAAHDREARRAGAPPRRTRGGSPRPLSALCTHRGAAGEVGARDSPPREGRCGSSRARRRWPCYPIRSPTLVSTRRARVTALWLRGRSRRRDPRAC